jgi:hypothetical protein
LLYAVTCFIACDLRDRVREAVLWLVLCSHMLYLLYLRDLLPVSRRHVETETETEPERQRDRD